MTAVAGDFAKPLPGRADRRPRPFPPALLRRHAAAEFAGMSASAWDRLNAAGGCPEAIRLGGCLAWGRRELGLWVQHGCPAREQWRKLWPAIRDRRLPRK